MTTATSSIQDRLRRIAAERFDATDILVTRTNERSPGSNSVPWYGMSIKLADGWHFVGRRRLMHELVELLQSLDQHDIDGRRL